MKNYSLHGLLFVSLLYSVGCDSPVKEPVQSDSTIDSSIIESWIKNQILQELPIEKVNYQAGAADLNNDSKAEHFVLIQDQYFCGSGGCSAYIFDNTGQMLNRMTVVQSPILLTDDYNTGWRDFIIWSNGEYRLMRHDGKSYPTNPSLQPAVKFDEEIKQATELVKNTELYQQDGYDIKQVEPKKIWASAYEYHFTFKHYGDPQSVYHATVNIKNDEINVVKTSEVIR